jgi:hypothetical protein
MRNCLNQVIEEQLASKERCAERNVFMICDQTTEEFGEFHCFVLQLRVPIQHRHCRSENIHNEFLFSVKFVVDLQRLGELIQLLLIDFT